ncbi:LOW QUALITY PROTEIN: uncharacterized protein ACOB7L_006440, partial [Callospermophilus lateralis]
WVVLEEAPRVVAALSEDMKPGHLPYGFPWELVVCTALGFFAVLSLFWRGFQSVRSRLYVGREKRLALNLAGLIEAKCGLLEKVSLVEKEHEGLESSLKDCRFEKGSREAQQLEATDEKLHRSESSHGVEMLFLEEELKAQKAQQGQQDETMAHLSRRIQSLQGESESLRSQIAEAKTNWRLFQVNEEELKLAIKEDESKGALRNLVYGDKLKASLEILEGGRNQKCTFSSEVEKTTEDLTEHLKSLQTEQASLQSENAQLQSENETLQENFKVMMERYQENMMKLHRKLRVEENYRVEQEEKLSKVEEKMSHTIKELETYRKRAQYLEEQLQSTIRSCLGKIISSEKEADASELEARIAERNLSYFRKQNARNRQKLTEKELRFELVEKDPYDALDVSNSAMGRKPSPNGPSPIGHPSSERRPPHFEKSGPLTLSPFTPVGGGRGSRGPGNPLDHATSSKGRESSCHKFTDFQRAPSQTGPLSPPGEQASRLMIPPPGQPYSSDARLPLQRQDRFYSNCGRASGPAEHRIPNMPPLDSDVPDSPLHAENQATPWELVWVVLEEAPRVVAALSEDMKPGHLPYGFPWELVVCTALGFFAVLSLFWRGFQSVRSRLYVGREKRLALNLAGLIEAKCGLLEKVSLVEKEHEGLESSLKDCRFEKGSREAQQLEATDEKLHRSESSHGVEMLFLEEELKAQKAQQGQQYETMAHLSRRIQSLQGESESLRSQIAEAKTNWRLFQVNEEELKLAIKELKASLEILEGGRNQKCTFSSEVEKTTEDLTEHLKSLQTEQASLQSENAQLQSENETLQENFKVMMERYQENMMKLHRKLRVEENYRVEQEEKLSKVEEKMSHTIKELETYRKRAQYLEEQLQSTIRSCLGKIISSEKEADASELEARIAERNLSYFRKQNARNRQKLTEKELRFELVEKDPYDALDVSNSAMGRKPSPNGPSPIGHPSSERRPPHFEKSGPLTLSPFTPVGGGRGSRGPGNPLDHATSSKGRESSCHKFTDFQRAPAQTGPLSPPGEQASRLMIPPPGQPYSSDARLPLQRQDRFYSNCGRASGPAEHRIPNMPPLDSDWVVLEEAPRVVAALSEDMKPGHLPYGFPWELVVCTALGFFAVLSLFWRGFQSVRSRLYVGREKRLALNLAGLIEAKCGLLEKVSLVEKEHEGLESSLKDCRFEKGSREAQQLEATDEKLHRSESSHGVEMLFLEEELKAQKAQQGQQYETMAHLSRRIQSLQGESESLRSQIAEAKTNWRLFQVNEEELKLAIKELKASLEILEGGRNQKCTFSSEVEKTTEDLTEHLKSLQTEQASLQSENAQLQSENETLQENFKVMMERYQENMMKLHRKLRVEENYRVEQEEKLSKVEEKMSHTIKELETYRKRAQYLEEQLQSTIRSCLGKIISSEKEADASELAARIAERNLSYFRKQNARNRQKLTEKELRFELVEKDPYDALDVSNSAMGRKPSPNGPSPIGHPSSERRPPHFEKSGPLTLSPFTPVGGGRGSRGPGNPLDHATSSKGRESSCHKFTDFQRAPSQTGPLSPPGEQASRLMIPPPGQPYSSDARLPLQRQDRFYSNCGRASGPAEHRIPNMPPLDSDWVVLEEAPRVVAALSEDMKPGHLPYGFPWELVVCTALGFFAVLSLFWRGFQSVRSRLYVGREKRLALNLAGLIEAKCGLLEKVSLVEKEHEGLESSLKDCRFEKGSREAQQLEATDEKLHRSESSHGVEMLFLEEELKAQKAQQGQQYETMAHLSRRIQSLQGESESLRSQIAEAKTNWRLFQVNEEELKLAIKELKASLEILEGGRNQKCTFSSEVEKTTEDLTEHLKSLQTEQASLQSENAQLQSENETLQENFKVMMERYQENMMKLHRKLRVEENYRVEQEEKLSKVEEKMSHTIKELETYRKRAQYLEEQLQSTIRSCLGKIISSEKEADASELEARIAERNLSYFRKQNARNRQKLTEKELRFELVEKDPYDALDVSNSAMGRKPSPNGPSPIGHPSSERRPPHFEKSGPLTLSPFTPVGGGRGSRGPGNPLDHATSSKGRESSCHKFTDFQRAPSQTGPLSPPGEQASRLMIPPPGQPYSSDARLPLQRQDRFYSNCGRASGPAEHRIPNMPPLDSD